MSYFVDTVGLQQNFPEHMHVPPLLQEFAQWLPLQPEGSLGVFVLKSDRFDDYWIENGADLHNYFAFFIRDPTGGNIGYWLYGGNGTKKPPIVYLGSEGELEVIASSLEEFLVRLADAKTGLPDLDDRDGEDSGGELREWLELRIASKQQMEQSDFPDLKQWLQAWGSQQRIRIDQDANHVQIAESLRKYVKPDAKPWETANFDVLLTGTKFMMWHRSRGPQPMPADEVQKLEPLFLAVRLERARQCPERGLWFSAWVRVGNEGGAVLCCNFMDRPREMPLQPHVDLRDYEADLSAYPRSDHWMPAWLASELSDAS